MKQQETFSAVVELLHVDQQDLMLVTLCPVKENTHGACVAKLCSSHF